MRKGRLMHVTVLLAVRESEVLSLTRQLDHNHRELEMYRMEINSLRHSVGYAHTYIINLDMLYMYKYTHLTPPVAAA